jgi:hypothetical protein
VKIESFSPRGDHGAKGQQRVAKVYEECRKMTKNALENVSRLPDQAYSQRALACLLNRRMLLAASECASVLVLDSIW